MRKILSLILTIVLCIPMGAVKVHTIGDSTMADYDPNTTDKRGWGMYLGSFFDPAFVTVNNKGKSGADSRAFYTGAAYWPALKNQMSAGDYLIIQFAHNDEGTVMHGLDNCEYSNFESLRLHRAYICAEFEELPELYDEEYNTGNYGPK